ncbi:hypothetical protein NW739_02680 [Mycoplasmopsis felis]|uniref:hypothetical protein n=1 Tax=Mycoplasmopsis felis TaxID=33923 RepID=UPI0021E0B537|nr:hypothetical protein [Mycoplasmopsis felis]MCU9939677.1 hypothetical protein [Mycoplasmopsis felis]
MVGNSRYITYLNIFNNPIANLKGLDRIEEDCKQNSVKYGDIFVTTSSEIREEVEWHQFDLLRVKKIYI